MRTGRSNDHYGWNSNAYENWLYEQILTGCSGSIVSTTDATDYTISANGTAWTDYTDWRISTTGDITSSDRVFYRYCPITPEDVVPIPKNEDDWENADDLFPELNAFLESVRKEKEDT